MKSSKYSVVFLSCMFSDMFSSVLVELVPNTDTGKLVSIRF